MRLGAVHTALSVASLALVTASSPVYATDVGRIEALVDQARATGCVIPDANAALEGAGVIRPDARENILSALVDLDRADRVGPAVVLNSTACHDGAAPTLRDRFLAVMGQGGACAQSLDGLERQMAQYGLTPRDVEVLRDEMTRYGELVISDDGATLRVTDAFCDQAKSLAAHVVPDARTAFVSFMAANDCRIGTRDLPDAVIASGLEPAATDVVIEALVSDGDAIYYGFDQTLILLWERCT
ncbi:hypothetical protein OO012_01945 [Rhodobacteraceae bacterium KMM 6894]|nr:hypothetical protein [Rhodobacteraceae bacterium KMM 6894]